MNISWQNLRPLDNSQNKAFEELCCQLARYESVPQGATFTRRATPDAGIECCWALPNGDEWGWQAKFFLSPPHQSQWRQIDASVKNALEKNPRLTSYVVCLPIDRADPEVEEQNWFMDEWNKHVAKWQRWAIEKKLAVEFDYWGNHEIFMRLARDEHLGRYFFWFRKELFSATWFKQEIKKSISNVGPRYTSELNVELPIAQLFESLGRTQNFYNKIRNLFTKVKKSFSDAWTPKAVTVAKDEYNKLKRSIKTLLLAKKFASEVNCIHIDWESISKLLSESIGNAEQCLQELETIAQENKKKAIAENTKKSSQHEDFGYQRHHLHELMRNLRKLQGVCLSNEALLSNLPVLSIIGKAGTGKTHLFCDIAEQRINHCLPTILVLGGHFDNSEPWTQIIRSLGLSCGREEFLGALEAAAQVHSARALILIDALNEGEGKKLWNKHLAGILEILSRYSWIGIAVSVRTSYVNIVLPDSLGPDKLIKVIHRGFADHEYQATKTFFGYYGIVRPSIPLLVPEFQNPLFLKLFCQGLRNRGLTQIPRGLQGITAIFDYFIESVNEKISKPENADFDPKSQIIQKSVDNLANAMARKGSRWLPREEAKDIIDSLLPRDSYEKSLFRHMISEGILAEDRFCAEEKTWHEGIHFSYERFSDHLIVRYYLNKHLDKSNPSKVFMSNNPIGNILKNEQRCWENQGFIEALSIQLPERMNLELSELAPHCAEYAPVRYAFIDSLIWRDTSAVTDATFKYLNNHVLKYTDSYGQFFNALLIIASHPLHPFNAEFLHKNLLKFEIAERDAWWTIFINNQYGEHGAVDRLIEWASSSEDKGHIDDKAIQLCGIALAWLLTASNRYLRDNATKALVSLFTERLHVLRQVIKEFLDVNDPYVLERLFAIVYGCVMRRTDDDEIAELARDTYDWIFKNGCPPPDVLLRDYARGVIEYALYHKIHLDVDIRKSRPPYKSTWPSFKIPSKEELRKYGETRKNMPDEEWARIHLYQSVMGFGDFTRYVIGTNFERFAWSSRRLNKPRKLLQSEVYDSFLKSLTAKQKRMWGKYINMKNDVEIGTRHRKNGSIEIFTKIKCTRKRLLQAKRAFLQTLGRSKVEIFNRHITPYLKNPRADKERYRFDLSIAQRWIFQKVLNLGWTVERFGIFDRYINRYSNSTRKANKSERMGKKYQWIAYHEFLARLSDNFEFVGDFDVDQPAKYEGPWQITYARDIDPSFLLKRTQQEVWKAHTHTWWFPGSYNVWDSIPGDIEWLKESKDLPPVESLLEVTNPTDCSKWLVMEALYKWEQPTAPEEERYKIPHRELWYILRGYIVKKSDIGTLFKWAKQQNFFGRWMPDPHEFLHVFLGEYFWSPAFLFHNIPHYNHYGWTRGIDNRIPRKVLLSTDQYLQEYSGYDCSIANTINICLPAKWLVDRMNLHWNGVEGHFFTKKCRLIAFDPSVKTKGPGVLLINKDELLNFLGKNGYDILWTIIGEKNVIGDALSGDWKGRLTINGAYRIYRDRIVGKIRPEFVSKH